MRRIVTADLMFGQMVAPPPTSTRTVDMSQMLDSFTKNGCALASSELSPIAMVTTQDPPSPPPQAGAVLVIIMLSVHFESWSGKKKESITNLTVIRHFYPDIGQFCPDLLTAIATMRSIPACPLSRTCTC